MNPSTGTIPLNVTVTCSATSALKYLIDCGNSTSISTPTGVCRYPTVGTYTAKCTINDTISSVACTKTIIPSASPLLSEVVIKKYAKEITAIGDSQTVPVKLAPGEVFNYYYQVQNISANPALDVMVKDTLPPYLTFTGNISIRNPANVDVTNDWILATGSTIFPGETLPRITFVGKKKTSLPGNSGLYTFVIPVVLSISVPTGIDLHNVAYVCASNDPTNPPVCIDDLPPPPPPTPCSSVTPGAQLDPACIQVVGQFDLSVKKYVK